MSLVLSAWVFVFALSNSALALANYDGDGNRVRKSVHGATTQYLVDELNPTGWPQVLEELTSLSGGPAAVTRTYTWGHALLAQDQLVGTNWQASLPLHDAHGSVRHLADLGGNVTDSYEYDAFGNLIARAGTTPNNRLYTGEEFDPDLGLYYLRARYHNPAQGRFWSQDSFEGFTDDPASLHKYTYAQNNPAYYTDPSGHFALSETLFVSALAPLVSQSLSGIWDGINHYSHGLAGGSALKATSHAEALFINSLAAGPGLNIGKENFWRTAKGAPFLLNWNPTIPIPESDCFRYEIVGGDYRIYGCQAKFGVFQFDFTSGDAYKTLEALTVPLQAGIGVAQAAAETAVGVGTLVKDAAGTVGYGLTAVADRDEFFGTAKNIGQLAWDVENALAYDVTAVFAGESYARGVYGESLDRVSAAATAFTGGSDSSGAFRVGYTAANVGSFLLPGGGLSRAGRLENSAVQLNKHAAVATAKAEVRAGLATEKAAQKVAAGVEQPSASVSVKMDDCQKAAKNAPIVIGENMQRVQAYANRVGGKTINDWIPSSQWSEAANQAWAQQMRAQGRQIIDVGPDFARRAQRVQQGIRPDAPAYNLERMEFNGYGNYQKLFERNGRYSGGVPGFDP